MSHGGSLFNNIFLALNLDWTLPQNHFYEAGGTETATPGYLLVGASAGTDIVIKDKSRLKYIGVYKYGAECHFQAGGSFLTSLRIYQTSTDFLRTAKLLQMHKRYTKVRIFAVQKGI